MTANDQEHRAILQSIAHQAMLDRGLLPDFSAAALAELGQLRIPAATEGEPVRDLRNLAWASIDNDDSLDLDQLTVAEALAQDEIKILVAIADVDIMVKTGSAIEAHAQHNTTSVYTAAEIFPMLPEKLSTDVTSLNCHEDRLAMVVEMVVGADGSLKDSTIYRAWVRSQAKLAYNSVGAWLENKGIIPEAITAAEGLAENLRLQDRAAQRLKNFRESQGALRLETIEARPVFKGEQLRALVIEEKNRAKEIIQDFMIAANGVVARYPLSRGISLALPRRPHAQALGPDCRNCPGTPVPTAGDARRQKRWRSFSSRQKPPTRCASPTCRWRSSSFWARANMWRNCRNGPARAILAWPSRIMSTPLLPTDVIPT